MKKILFTIICIFLFLNCVKADYYTSWNEQRSFDSKYEEKETRYRFYKEIEEGKYTILNSNYEYIDEDDYIYSEHSNWQEDCSDIDLNNHEIEVKKIYPYQEILPGRYLMFSKFNRRISFEDIDIKINGDFISYEIFESYFCDDDNCDYRNMDFLKIDLLNEYNLRDLKIYIDSVSDGIGCFSVWFSSDKEFNLVSAKKTACNHVNDITAINQTWVNSSTVYSEIKYSDIPMVNNGLDKLYDEITMCRYRQKLMYHYNIKKQYFDENYHHDIENYIKDINDYKVFYRYLIKEEQNIIGQERNKDKNGDTSCLYEKEETSIDEEINKDSDVVLNVQNDIKEESKLIVEEESLDDGFNDSKKNNIEQTKSGRKNIIINFLQIRKNNLIKNKYIVLLLVTLLIGILFYRRKMSIK